MTQTAAETVAATARDLMLSGHITSDAYAQLATALQRLTAAVAVAEAEREIARIKAAQTIEIPARGQTTAEYLTGCGFERVGTDEWARDGVTLLKTRYGWGASFGDARVPSSSATAYEARVALARKLA